MFSTLGSVGCSHCHALVFYSSPLSMPSTKNSEQIMLEIQQQLTDISNITSIRETEQQLTEHR